MKKCLELKLIATNRDIGIENGIMDGDLPGLLKACHFGQQPIKRTRESQHQVQQLIRQRLADKIERI
jgi:hypothetical protein